MDTPPGVGPDGPENAFFGAQTSYAPVPGEPIHAVDTRFILTEVGKLTTKVDRLIEDVSKLNPKVDRLIEDVGKLNPKVDTLRGQVAFVKGAAWVIGVLVVVVGPVVGLIASGKLSITLH